MIPLEYPHHISIHASHTYCLHYQQLQTLFTWIMVFLVDRRQTLCMNRICTLIPCFISHPNRLKPRLANRSRKSLHRVYQYTTHTVLSLVEPPKKQDNKPIHYSASTDLNIARKLGCSFLISSIGGFVGSPAFLLSFSWVLARFLRSASMGSAISSSS
jgi:hypothetical protein